ncbi:MAG: hypothetical protein M3154_12450 [Candidatus Eremiobacteraeota bacterium]|nr:hypothetical protein [Candidatus Eremiobacteraeota bacterium]
MKAARVLIVSGDVLVAALLGALADAEGFEALFVGDGESPRAALARLRPDAVLIDCESDASPDEHVLGPAMMTGATIVVLGPARARPRMESLRARYGVHVLEIPIEPHQLRAILASTGLA